jgi:hypothetical protein
MCFVCALVRRLAITGTLDPVRNSTVLTLLSLSQNSIGGTFVRTIWSCGGGGCVGVWIAVVSGITAAQMQGALQSHFAFLFCLDVYGGRPWC